MPPPKRKVDAETEVAKAAGDAGSVNDGTGMLIHEDFSICETQCLQELTMAGLGGDVLLHLPQANTKLTIIDLKQQLEMQALREERIVCFEVLHESSVLEDTVTLAELSLPSVATLQVMITMPQMAAVEAMLTDAQRRFAAAKHLMSFGDSGRRCKAIEAFRKAGEPGVSHVARALKDDCATVRSAAFRVLADAPALAAPYSVEIAALLRDPDRSLRKLVSKNLKAIMLPTAVQANGPQLIDSDVNAVKLTEIVNIASASHISHMMQDEDDRVRKCAVEAIGRLGCLAAPHMVEIVALLSDTSANVRQHAVEALGNIGALAAAHIHSIAKLLEDTDPGVKGAAAEALGKIGVLAYPCAGQLAELLSDVNVRVRRHTCHALGRIGMLAACSAPQLSVCLKDADDGVRYRAVQAMAKLGKLAHSHAAEVCLLLKDTDKSVRRAAAEALGKITVQYEEHACDLAESLRLDSDVTVRTQAASSLAHLGPAAMPYIVDLVAAMARKKDSSLRCAASATIGELAQYRFPAPHDVKDSVQRQLFQMIKDGIRDGNVNVEQHAAEALCKGINHLSPTAEEMREMVSMLSSRDRIVRIHAVEAFGKMGRGASHHVDAVVRCSSDTDLSVREKAASAICKVSRGVAGRARELTDMLHDADHKVRSEAAEALGKMYSNNLVLNHAVQDSAELAACLHDPSFDVRQQAAEALGKLGARAVNVAAHVAELQALRDTDKDMLVRESAEKALKIVASR